MKYRNTITGVEIIVQSEISGDWELVPDSPESAETVPADEQAKPKRKRKAK